MMGQEESRAVFDALLIKDHMAHALIHHGDKHNDIPTLLATIVMLGGTSAQLQVAYEHRLAQLEPWPMSSDRVSYTEQYLGDPRFQRAYMDYFSLEVGRHGSNARAQAIAHLVSGPKPLLYGLFGGFGQPLMFLADAIELPNAIVLVQSLVLASVDWSEALYDLLTDSMSDMATTMRPESLLPPASILFRVATDSRYGGVMRGATGFGEVSRVLANGPARAALGEHMCQLDTRDTATLLQQLAELSVLLLCGSHKPGKPAFDFYLGQLPALVHCLHVLLPDFDVNGDDDGEDSRLVLIHGVWLLLLLAYVTQLRPVLDKSLISRHPGPHDDLTTISVFYELHGRPETLKGKYLDTQFLRAMRSMVELASWSPGREDFFMGAACKLRDQWQEWTGLGPNWDRNGGLNIRL